MRKITITIAALSIGALALSSCGRRGPLELPPEKPQTAAQAAKAAKPKAVDSMPTIRVAPNDQPIVLDGSGDSIDIGPTESSDGQPFFLDSLIN